MLGPAAMHSVPDADDPSRLIPLADCAIGGSFVVSAKLWARLGGFDASLWAADTDLLRRATALVPDGIVRCPEPTYLYIRTPGDGVCEEVRTGVRRSPSTPA